MSSITTRSHTVAAVAEAALTSTLSRTDPANLDLPVTEPIDISGGASSPAHA